MAKVTPKNMVNMLKEFHSAWKTRKENYENIVGKKKKKKK